MKKRNQLFDYMKALLIIMVIDDHVNSHIGLLTSIFPYDSFFVPSFVVISGYFYKYLPVKVDIKKRINSLFIPYTIWCILGNLIALLLAKYSIVYWHNFPSLKNVYLQCFYAPISEINGPGWFVIMLFYVCIVYNCVRHIFKTIPNLIFDYGLLAVSIIVGLVQHFISRNALKM